MQEDVVKNLEDKIKLKDFKLHSLLEITKSINTNQPINHLTRIFEFVLREQLGLDKFILFSKEEEEWNIFLKIGIKGKIKDISVEKDLMRFKDVTVIESSHKSSLNKFDVIIPVQHKGKPLAFLLIGGLLQDREKMGGIIRNMSFIQTLTNIIIVAIENKRMANESIKQERLKKDLEIAVELQKQLFPSELPSNQKLDVSAKFLPRHEIGGDYYDFIQINENEFMICIADVSGKGISAAMLMANFQATIRTLFHYQNFDLEDLIQELNDKVIKASNGDKFITFFIAKYNAKTRKLKYINAGHNYPLLVAGNKTRELAAGCPGLGMLDELPFLESEEIEISPNTTIVLYTDGVVELENREGQPFETENLLKIIRNFYPLKMEDLNNILFSKLEEWKGKNDFVDDTAILTCRIF